LRLEVPQFIESIYSSDILFIGIPGNEKRQINISQFHREGWKDSKTCPQKMENMVYYTVNLRKGEFFLNQSTS